MDAPEPRFLLWQIKMTTAVIIIRPSAVDITIIHIVRDSTPELLCSDAVLFFDAAASVLDCWPVGKTATWNSHRMRHTVAY